MREKINLDQQVSAAADTAVVVAGIAAGVAAFEIKRSTESYQ